MTRQPLLERAFARLTRLLPTSFNEYGADMAATFVQRAREARLRGRLRFASCVLREFAGLARTALRERFAPATVATTDREALSPMEHLLREMRHAARRLIRTPGFTVASLFTLALAIGANTAIFALLHRIVLSPLPYPTPERLVALDHTAPGVGLPSDIGMTAGLFREYGKLPSVEAIALYRGGERTLTGEGDAERIATLDATPSLGGIVGARPVLGRWFTEADGREGAPNVVVLSHALWVRRFRASPAALENSIRLDGDAFQVIGVMPADFAFPDTRAGVILPIQVDPTDTRMGGFNWLGIARLRSGATVDDTRRQQDAVIADLPARFPADLAATKAMVGSVRLAPLPQSFTEHVLGNTAQTLWVLLAAVATVLLIACANLANLFLVRTDSRLQEVAVRQALGASTTKIATFFLGEAMIVAIVSGALGLAIGDAALRLLVHNAPIALPRLHEVRIDALVVSFTLLASALAGLTFGVMPLMRRRPAVASVLQDAGRGNSAGRSRMRSRQVLMATQVSLAVVLLVAAGLMSQSFYRLQRVDPGFRSNSRLIFTIGLAQAEYQNDESAAAFHERLLERLRALPGVQQAALTTTLPLDGQGSGDPLDVRGRDNGADKVGAVVRFRRVSTEYFSAMGIPLRQGRLFADDDMSGKSNAVLIDEVMARQYFPAQDAIGQQVRRVGGKDQDGWLTVVGIVGNTVTNNLRESTPAPKMYFPMRTAMNSRISSTHLVSYVIRTSNDPIALVPVVRRTLGELNPNVAISRLERMTDLVERAAASLAFLMVLLVLAAAVALLLGLVGVYAVIAYGVTQRTSEIGVRLALGASPNDVTGMIVRQSGRVIAIGVVVGIGAAIASARLLQALLFGVSWNDGVTYGAVAIGLFGIAMLACWLPARRAASLNPIEALRRS